MAFFAAYYIGASIGGLGLTAFRQQPTVTRLRLLEQISCDGCGRLFEKDPSEIKRQRKRNPHRKFYCTLKCFGAHGAAPLKPDCDTSRLRADNRRDEFSPFRYFLRKARQRKHHVNIDLPYLKTLWEKQQGRCAISGIQLTLPPTVVAWEQRKNDPWKPSLDRIENALGYVKGNVRFVACIANFAKNRFTDDCLVEFCHAVVAHHSNPDSE